MNSSEQQIRPLYVPECGWMPEWENCVQIRYKMIICCSKSFRRFECALEIMKPLDRREYRLHGAQLLIAWNCAKRLPLTMYGLYLLAHIESGGDNLASHCESRFVRSAVNDSTAVSCHCGFMAPKLRGRITSPRYSPGVLYLPNVEENANRQ